VYVGVTKFSEWLVTSVDNKQAFMSRAHENGRFLRESPIVGLISGYVRLVKYKIIGTPSSESFEQGSSRPYFFGYFTWVRMFHNYVFWLAVFSITPEPKFRFYGAVMSSANDSESVCVRTSVHVCVCVCVSDVWLTLILVVGFRTVYVCLCHCVLFRWIVFQSMNTYLLDVKDRLPR